ncbi:BcepGomrgp40 [Burkholderia phage BcepGomr]|uniref:BcepGomrgp40 n=1 Tax=Burkholderia phage BcepGomr TaxID=437329 RepID=UPI00015034F9|nr:BcepGomrgp40 [Burkholderia phage BcepGomr]ABP63611.1 BcepGomrgp40 [Burkholderia phage BcepGomr]
MIIVIDRDNLRMVAGTNSRNHAHLIAEVDFSNVATLLVSTEGGRDWTVLTDLEIRMMFKNMSGMESPPYGEAIKQLRAYGETFPVYPKGEAELERTLTELRKLDTPEDAAEHVEAVAERSVENRQAIIAMAEAANPALSRPAERVPEAEYQAARAKPASAPKPAGEAPSAPRKPGATKMVWDICDRALETWGGGEINKAFREAAKKACVDAGINEGTFGVQFGKWKSSKGV